MTARALVLVLTLTSTLHAQDAGQPPDPPIPWWQRVTFNGDARVRYEGQEIEPDASRHRFRFRLRLSASAEPLQDLQIGVRLASGDPDNPASAEQTFTDMFARKPLSIDQAWGRYEPRAVRGLTLGIGKFPVPVLRTEQTWDEDVHWEGFYERIRWAPMRPVTLSFIAVQSPMQEAADEPDTFMFVHAGEVDWRRGDHRLRLALADYRFREVDRVALAVARGDLRTRNTNLVRRRADGTVLGFASSFHLLNLVAAGTLQTGRPDYPLSLTADYVTNLAAVTDRDAGLWLETTYGRAANPGTVSIKYVLAWIQEDAVLSPFNQSNIPGTNLRLHMGVVSYMPRPAVNFDVETFLTRPLFVRPGDADEELLRVHVATRVRF